MSAWLTCGRRRIEITHPDKLLFRGPDVTKLELVRHYDRVGQAMLAHLRGRPLALEVFPQGIDHRGFFLKAMPSHFPDWIERTEVPKRGGSLIQVLARDRGTLVYLAGQNMVTPHVWLSRVDALREPDRLIIDLDPSPGIEFAEVRGAAREAGRRLRDVGLVPYAMLTGSRGVHVVAPLRRGPSFKAVHSFARRLAEEMVAEDPARLTLEWHTAERGRRIYLDVNRINYAQHAVAAYAARARSGAPVAMPIHWDEFEDPRCRPDRWSVRDAADRVAAEGDAWQGMSRHARRLR
ncbi:MAG: non-homologous end-joining DNA ligase [Solirubrobacteraceae bacterium]